MKSIAKYSLLLIVALNGSASLFGMSTLGTCIRRIIDSEESEESHKALLDFEDILKGTRNPDEATQQTLGYGLKEFLELILENGQVNDWKPIINESNRLNLEAARKLLK